MKLFKKIVIVILLILFVAIIGNGIYLSQMGKTVDCSGVVDFVDVENQTIKITDADNVQYLLKVKFYTSIKDTNNDKIDINKIEVGDTITANYRGEWKSSDSELISTYIRVSK